MSRDLLALLAFVTLAVTITGEPLRLTTDPGDDRQPVFSPDGDRILFESNRDGDWEIYTMAVDGSRVKRLTDHPADDRFAAWGPAGERIVCEIHRVTSKAGHDFCPTFSPDGRFLAAASRAADERFIAVFSLDGTLLYRIAHGFERATHPSWSPDGRNIVFAGRQQGGYDVYIAPLPAVLSHRR